ncbi:MAG TPA: GxGYxYP domain-containing protein [Armatimonadota bacterium]|nr:GxGYxYP domain-containing protein [Armatimonadota bacterium]
MSIKSYILDVYTMSVEEKISAISLQGIVNRDAPNVFYRSRFWNWPEADEKWIEWFREAKGVEFTQLDNLPQLIERFRDRIKGCVVWDPRLDQTKWIAATTAGTHDLLPIAPECIGRYGDLPIVEDLRGRWNKEMEAARWAADNLIEKTNRRIAYSVEVCWSGCTVDSIDYVVRERGFIYSLRHGKRREGEGDWQEEQCLARQVHSRIGPNAPIFGWGEPEEDYCRLISHHNNFIMCSEAPNLSYFARIPCYRTDWTQEARRDPSSFVLEDKHYIAFNTSEGDSPKMHAALQGGAWFDQNRGNAPINWGANPICLKFFPALLEYYWDTATEKDYFMGGASGAGYVYPNMMPNPQAYFEQVREYFAKADMHDTEAWLHFSGPVYDKYAEVSGMESFAMPCGPYGVTAVNGGSAVVFMRGNSKLNYFNARGTAEDLANAIKEHCEKRPKPSFSTTHLVPDADNPAAQGGYSPSDFVKVQELLGPEYRVVTMQELAALAKRALKEGKLLDALDPGYSEWDEVHKRK